MPEPSSRDHIRTALQAVRDQQTPTAAMLAPLLGRMPQEAERTVAANMLASLEAWPLEEAVDTVAEYLANARASQDVLAAHHRSVDELFECARSGRPLSLAVRDDFGAYSAYHQEVLTDAIRDGVLDREDALACIRNGRRLTEILGDRAVARVPITFQTVAASGMPFEAQRAPASVEFQQTVLVETSGAPILLVVSNESELRQAAAPEADTVAWLQQTLAADSVLMDVGANIGLYSLYAAQLHDTVRAIALEPGAMNYARLNVNIRTNDLQQRVVAFPVAAWDRTTLTTFANSNFFAGGWGHRGLVSKAEHEASVTADVAQGVLTEAQAQASRERHLESVDTGCAAFRIDDLVAYQDLVPLPTHLKIDVDGPHLEVLRGADQALRNDCLRHILIEVFDVREESVVSSLLAPYGFSLTSGARRGFGNRVYTKLDSTSDLDQ